MFSLDLQHAQRQDPRPCIAMIGNLVAVVLAAGFAISVALAYYYSPAWLVLAAIIFCIFYAG